MSKISNLKDFNVERLRSFYKTQPCSVLASLASAIVVFLIYKESVGPVQNLWLTIHVLLSLLRLSYLFYIKIRFDIPEKVNSYLLSEKIYSTILFLKACAWGATAFVFFPLSTTEYILIPFMFPLCILVGGVARMSLSKIASIAYVVGIILAFSSYFVTNWSSYSIPMLFGSALFSTYLLQTTKKNYELYVKLHMAIKEKESLLDKANENIRLEKELALQKEINVQNSKLASLGEMASGIAHEINNPLGILKLNTESLLKKIDRKMITEEKLITVLTNSSLTIDRMAKIVTGMLTFSREHDIDEKDYISIEKVVEDTLELSQSKFFNNGIKIIKEFEMDSLVYANSVAISQVLINILNNSFYFIKDLERPWVKIKISESESFMVEVLITDSGKNIESHIQEKLFNPFFSTKPIGQGTGLGLSISKSILASHGGDLNYISGDHPAFSITFPKNRSHYESHTNMETYIN